MHTVDRMPKVNTKLLVPKMSNLTITNTMSRGSFTSFILYILTVGNYVFGLSGMYTVTLKAPKASRKILQVINRVSSMPKSEKKCPVGYGGGMNSAKVALESDTRVLAFEAGRKKKIRVNTISAGPLGSRAAKAIGFIDTMIDYSYANAPIQKELFADEVGNTAAFLASPLASAITGALIYVDNGLNAMGVGVDSPLFKDLNIPTDKH